MQTLRGTPAARYPGDESTAKEVSPMAKRRTISYRNTALLSVVSGGIALAVAIVDAVSLQNETDLGVAGTIMGAIGILAFLLGAAAGVLSLSTEYKRVGIVGLALCGIALGIFVILPLLFGG
jgi:hypothetical protein